MKILRQHVYFPITNALVFAMLSGLTGFFVGSTVQWGIIGLLTGLMLGIIVEWTTLRIGERAYRWRMVTCVLLEIILAITVFAPFVYMYMSTIPGQRSVECGDGCPFVQNSENIYIPVADGEVLAAWFMPPADSPGPVIILSHGSNGDRSGTLEHARVLHESGFGVLTYDQRACGESTGNRQSMGLYDTRDIKPIIDWLVSQPEVDESKIGGVGLSLGAHILLRAAPDEPRLRALWLDGLGANGTYDVPPSRDASEMFMNFVEGQTYWMAEQYLGEKWIPCKVLIPRVAPRYLMLVAAGQDYYELDFNKGYQPYLGENAGLWIIENAWHTGGIFDEPVTYRKRMVEFFQIAFEAAP